MQYIIIHNYVYYRQYSTIFTKLRQHDIFFVWQHFAHVHLLHTYNATCMMEYSSILLFIFALKAWEEEKILKTSTYNNSILKFLKIFNLYFNAPVLIVDYRFKMASWSFNQSALPENNMVYYKFIKTKQKQLQHLSH